MKYHEESINLINEAYRLLDEAKNHPESFKPYKWRPLDYPYCLVLSKDDWKLTLCTRTVARCITNDVTYEKVKALDDNQQVHELLGVYIDCLRKIEEDSKKNDDYCKAAVEFARQLDDLIDMYNSQEPSDDHCTMAIWNGTTAYLLDGCHTLTIWHDGKISLCRVEENGGFRHRKEIGDAFIINKRVNIAPLLKKYLDSLREHAKEL